MELAIEQRSQPSSLALDTDSKAGRTEKLHSGEKRKVFRYALIEGTQHEEAEGELLEARCPT